MSEIPQIELLDGKQIPQLGFGTYKLTGDQAQQAVETALELGYRHIDTAEIYQNEAEIGAALAAAGLPREELYLTTKVWNDHHAAADTRAALATSLEKLGLDYVDLYLIHWPATVSYGDSFIECWDTLQDLQAEGLIASIGVSNFHAHHLARLQGAIPVVDQVELHPKFNQAELRDYLNILRIKVTAWSPLARGSVDDDPAIQAISTELGKTPSQIILRWHLQLGNMVIPRSGSRPHIEANLNIFDFELTEDHMAQINAISRPDGRTGLNPDLAEF